MAKQQKVTVQLTVQVPEGTSKTKVEKTLSTLLKSGSTPEGFKVGAPKVVTPAPASKEPEFIPEYA
jgi:hypothetical protein